MRTLKISELQKVEMVIDQNQNDMSPVTLKSVFDWIVEQAKSGDFKIILNEKENQITFLKIN